MNARALRFVCVQIYGSQFFHVEPQMNMDIPDEVFLAVNPKGILIINPDTKDILVEHPYSEVRQSPPRASSSLASSHLLSSPLLFSPLVSALLCSPLVSSSHLSRPPLSSFSLACLLPPPPPPMAGCEVSRCCVCGRQVPTWGHSGMSFVLHIGNLLKQTKLYFQVRVACAVCARGASRGWRPMPAVVGCAVQTEQGKEINDLVRAYVNHLCG
jgi:hypothetical protein